MFGFLQIIRHSPWSANFYDDGDDDEDDDNGKEGRDLIH